MGIEALTLGADGTANTPLTQAEWRDWISGTATRAHALDDPLIDWLDLYGHDVGFRRDDEIEGYDPRTDFSTFIMAKGTTFEAAVVAHLRTLVPIFEVTVGPPAYGRDLTAAELTFTAMQRGEPAIYQAVLRDAVSRCYGSADLLIRSDELRHLFPTLITVEEAAVPAPDLGNRPWHYRVVDIKFTTLHFTAGGELSDTTGSTWAYKQQVYIYNRALGRLQGYEPREAFLLGRSWEQPHKGDTLRSTSCLSRLGAVPQDYVSHSKGALSDAVEEACAWVRRVRTEGHNWQVLPEPPVEELRPNMSSTSDQPWHAAKQAIGRELEDLTLLWQVGLGKRREANAAGLHRWTDPACTPAAVGVNGKATAPILQAILDINRTQGGPPLLPEHVRAAENEWRTVPLLEFYVDFETVSDLDDDLTRIPERGGQPLIFMIGCGHLEMGAWRFSLFITDRLTEACEAEIIDGWLSHMAAVRQRIDPTGAEPKVIHWSPAEQSTFETAFNSAKNRHTDREWPAPRWFDFLKHVVKAEPIVVRGAFGFGLKAVTKAMHAQGLIETKWESGPTDGMGAMVGAWSAKAEAAERECTLPETELMQGIAEYNEVDCKAMADIVQYLRRHH